MSELLIPYATDARLRLLQQELTIQRGRVPDLSEVIEYLLDHAGAR